MPAAPVATETLGPQVGEGDDLLSGLEFAPACQMWRCRTSPGLASTVMTVSPPTCSCRAVYLACTGCVAHFWAVMAARKMQCEDHPVAHLWAEVTAFRPLPA